MCVYTSIIAGPTPVPDPAPMTAVTVTVVTVAAAAGAAAGKIFNTPHAEMHGRECQFDVNARPTWFCVLSTMQHAL